MKKATIYHNPRCSKSRETLSLLTSRGIDTEVILYLVTSPLPSTLSTIICQLGFQSAKQLIRKKEAIYLTLNPDDALLSEARYIEMMVAHPTLIERPIVIYNNHAKLGRPPENVLTLF